MPKDTGTEQAQEQAEFDGFRPVKHRTIDAQFKKFLDAKGAESEAREARKAAKQKLYDVMQEHKQPVYVYRGYTAKLTTTEEVQIHKTTDAEKNGDDETDADVDAE